MNDDTDMKHQTPRRLEAVPVYVVSTDCDAQVDLVYMIRTLARGWKTIAASLVVAGLVTWGVLWAVPKTYESNALIALNPCGDKDVGSIRSYGLFVGATSDLERILDELGLGAVDGKPCSRGRAVWTDVDARKGTIRITARCRDAAKAQQLADKVAAFGLQRIRDVVVGAMKYEIADVESQLELARTKLNVIQETEASLRNPVPQAGRDDAAKATDGSGRFDSALDENAFAVKVQIATLEARLKVLSERVASKNVMMPVIEIDRASSPARRAMISKVLIYGSVLFCALIGVSMLLLMRDVDQRHGLLANKP